MVLEVSHLTTLELALHNECIFQEAHRALGSISVLRPSSINIWPGAQHLKLPNALASDTTTTDDVRINDHRIGLGCCMGGILESITVVPFVMQLHHKHGKTSAGTTETHADRLQPSHLSSGYYLVANLAIKYAWPSWLGPTVRLTELRSTLRSLLESCAKHTIYSSRCCCTRSSLSSICTITLVHSFQR